MLEINSEHSVVQKTRIMFGMMPIAADKPYGSSLNCTCHDAAPSKNV